MHEADYQMAVVDHHSGNDPFTTTESSARVSHLGITMFPTLIPDGLPEPTWPYTEQILSNTINDRLAVDAPCTIEFSGSVSGNDLSLDLTILKDADATMPNPRVHLTVTESHIPYSGTGYTEMNFVNRDMVPDQNGTDITIEGDSHSMHYDLTLDEEWNQDHIVLVAWVEDATNHHVMQAHKIALSELQPALEAPLNLSAEINGETVLLSWDAPSTTPDSYNIYKNDLLVDNIAAIATSYQTTITEGSYTFFVKAMYNGTESPASNIVTVVENVTETPTQPFLNVYPNPFSISSNLRNNGIEIQYNVPVEGKTELSIYNIQGKKIQTLVNEKVSKGEHLAHWNGMNTSQNNVSAGVYLLRLENKGRIVSTKKFILLK
jgi:hypothetical protein